VAIAPQSQVIPAQQYLASSYRPDRELVNGHLRERAETTYLHSILQALLIAYFRPFEKEHRFKVLPELRTQIVEGRTYRIPDILLCAVPVGIDKIMTQTPLAVIEILSPSDTIRETLARFRDYAHLGVPYIVQMDPDTQVAHRYENGSLIETSFRAIDTGGRVIPFDSEHIFAELRREVDESATGL
jgi:Uma2 family endonuclease